MELNMNNLILWTPDLLAYFLVKFESCMELTTIFLF